jgi:hypothetical protein
MVYSNIHGCTVVALISKGIARINNEKYYIIPTEAHVREKENIDSGNRETKLRILIMRKN